ncbi:hypothetical protein EYF80_022261 [Liparis tanakae]|uniref:Uncharacterized protein n=1 Tax=Liparis tanakae TaxID=230148 RepID=A0A4Z2HQA5_9TELE|nr:hypothetical protein EYF80_022261 [Liparis tanakae]
MEKVITYIRRCSAAYPSAEPRRYFPLQAENVDKRRVGGVSQVSQTRAPSLLKRQVLECKMTKRHGNDNRPSGPRAKSRRSERV